KQPRNAATIQRIPDRAQERCCDGNKPPALPYWRQDSERETSRSLAHHAIGVDRTHRKAIAAWRETGKVHSALIAGRTPILARAFELILITQPLARAEAQRDESNLQLVPARAKFNRPDLSLSQRRNQLSLPGNSESGNK